MLVRTWGNWLTSHSISQNVKQYILWKTSQLFLLKLNMKLSYEPGVACLGSYSRKVKICAHVKTYIHIFFSRFTCNSQKLETTQMPFQMFSRCQQCHSNDLPCATSSCPHLRAWQALLDAYTQSISPSKVISMNETDMTPAIMESQFWERDK